MQGMMMLFQRREANLFVLDQMLEMQPQPGTPDRERKSIEDGCFVVLLQGEDNKQNTLIGISNCDGKSYFDCVKDVWSMGVPSHRIENSFQVEATEARIEKLTVIQPYDFEEVPFSHAVSRYQNGYYKEVQRKENLEEKQRKLRHQVLDDRVSVLTYLWNERLKGHYWTQSGGVQEQLYGVVKLRPKRSMVLNRRTRLVVESLKADKLVTILHDSHIFYSIQITPAGVSKLAEWTETRRLESRQRRHDRLILRATALAAIAAFFSAVGTGVQSYATWQQTETKSTTQETSNPR